MGCGCKCNNPAGIIAIMAGVTAAVTTSWVANSAGKASNSDGLGVMAAQAPVGEDMMSDDYVLGYTMNLIDGEAVDLAQYEGKVVLMVNTASKCGLTPQYKGLEALYNEHKDEGLIVLGFPANDFGGQEPGSNDEIAAFCEKNYGVSFPLFAKISVKGSDAHPLFKQLAALSEEPTWNFTKFLVDRQGRFVERFDPRTAPEDPKLADRVAALVGAAASTAP